MGTAWRVLAEAGVDVLPTDARHLRLSRADRSGLVALHASRRPVSPSEVDRITSRHPEPGLLVVPSVTDQTRAAVERAGWSWLVVGPQGARGRLRVAETTVVIGQVADSSPASHPRRTGPTAWGRFTLMRRLLDQPPSSQTRLASRAHVTQPRVSQILSDLADHHLVRRAARGWQVDAPGLLRHWLDTYPGPGGISTYWAGLAAPWAQAKAAIAKITQATRAAPDGPPRVVVSGDVGADLIAPWRAPTSAVVYAEIGHDLSDAGLTPVGPDEATLELIVPEDQGVWPVVPAATESSSATPPPVAAADPLQVLWDVRRGGGPAADEAAARLAEAILARVPSIPGAARHEG
jgi:hypothetical protein